MRVTPAGVTLVVVGEQTQAKLPHLTCEQNRSGASRLMTRECRQKTPRLYGP